MKEKSNESAENYLETILVLSKRLPVVRSVDIANQLDFKKSSVSIAMKNLREKNHITVTDAGYIYLTESGKAIADMIYERHQLLTSCLEKLGVPADIAEKDACKIEHVISKESFEAIKEHLTTNIKEFYYYGERENHQPVKSVDGSPFLKMDSNLILITYKSRNHLTSDIIFVISIKEQ